MSSLFRSFFLWLSSSQWLRRMATQIPIAYQVASRFFAGETLPEAVQAIRALQEAGLTTTVDILGEDVEREEEARRARDGYLELLDEMDRSGIATDISLKLTQFGLDLGLDFCAVNVDQVVKRAAELGVHVTIDMEDSTRTEPTLAVWRRLHAEHENVGPVIQAYLYRSEEDLRQICAAGARVRLCKGAYKEPPEVAFPEKADVDASMVKLMKLALDQTLRAPEGEKPYLGMATHDEEMIAATQAYAHEIGLPRDAYEFQMLYGIRRDLQDRLATEGYRMRVYAPYGTEWFPYYMRRMAERPANVWFVVRALLKESGPVLYVVLGAVLGLLLLWGWRRQKRD
jgi:proline dehydrogenase